MSEPKIYKPSIYNGPTVYNNGGGGGGGDGPIFNIPFEFEPVDSIYNKYNVLYRMGVDAGDYTQDNYCSGRIMPIKNNGYIKVRFWKAPWDDHIGGNANYIFGFREKNYTSRLNYLGDSPVCAVIQHSNIIIKNGSTQTSIDRTSLLHGGVNELILEQGKAYINGSAQTITYSEKSLYYINGLCFRGGNYDSYIDGTTADGPSMAFASLEAEDLDGAKLAIICAKRKSDNEIGFLDCTSVSFIRNNDNDALAVKSFV